METNHKKCAEITVFGILMYEEDDNVLCTPEVTLYRVIATKHRKGTRKKRTIIYTWGVNIKKFYNRLVDFSSKRKNCLD